VPDTYRNSFKGLIIEYLLFRHLLVNERYEKDAGNLLKNNSIIDSEVLDKLNEKNYLELIAKMYHDLDSLRDRVQVESTECRLTIKDFNKREPPFAKKDYSAIAFLQNQLKRRLDKQVDFFLIHGSYATADFVMDWSDLDTFVILNKEVFNDVQELKYAQKELQRLSLLCYKINPLAHHTFFIFPPLILKHYLSIFLPIPVLEYSLALKKENDLILQRVEGRVEEFHNLWGSLAHFRKKVIDNNYSKDLFNYENDIVGLLILPALMLQMRGEPIYKKFSFDGARRVFPDFDFNLVSWASKKRSDWVLFNLLKFYPNRFFNLLPSILNNYLINKYRFYLMRFKKTTHLEEVENFTKKALNLYETFFNYCLKNHKDNVSFL
jgi:hypothetical protein